MNYSISALSVKTGLSIHTLRYYEKEQLLRHVERTASGRRVYGEASIGTLYGILCLKEAGLTLPQIKRFFDATTEGDETLAERLSMLRAAKSNLIEEKKRLERSITFVKHTVIYSEKALQAQARGHLLEDSYPLLTLKGMKDFPFFNINAEGKLEPYIPEDFIETNAKKKPHSTEPT